MACLHIWLSPEDVSLIAQECLTLSCQNKLPKDIISLRFNRHPMCSWPLSCVLPHRQSKNEYNFDGVIKHMIEAKNTFGTLDVN